MHARNDVKPLADAGIPVRVEQYKCGCWGRHHPPRVEGNEIIIEVGEGYRSNNHLHGQNLYVLDVDEGRQVALIEMRKYGDLYGAGIWHYLIGIDGGPFVAMVPARISSVQDALDYLIPAEVQRAIARGLEVQRQGDWFFIPASRVPAGEIHREYPLADHVAEEAIVLSATVYVRGNIRHPQHGVVCLMAWHKAIRNKALRPMRRRRRMHQRYD